MSRLLSEDELQDLTGFLLPAKQLEWIRAFGLRAVVSASARPHLTIDAVTLRMSGSAPIIGASGARFVPDSDLVRLTGYILASKQIKLLNAHDLNPAVRMDGRPRLTFDALTLMMIGTAPNAQSVLDGVKPNWDALKKIARK